MYMHPGPGGVTARYARPRRSPAGLSRWTGADGKVANERAQVGVSRAEATGTWTFGLGKIAIWNSSSDIGHQFVKPLNQCNGRWWWAANIVASQSAEGRRRDNPAAAARPRHSGRGTVRPHTMILLLTGIISLAEEAVRSAVAIRPGFNDSQRTTRQLQSTTIYITAGPEQANCASKTTCETCVAARSAGDDHGDDPSCLTCWMLMPHVSDSEVAPPMQDVATRATTGKDLPVLGATTTTFTGEISRKCNMHPAVGAAPALTM
jgi:hypothetical protein